MMAGSDSGVTKSGYAGVSFFLPVGVSASVWRDGA
jgi:hypothetical protein